MLGIRNTVLANSDLRTEIEFWIFIDELKYNNELYLQKKSILYSETVQKCESPNKIKQITVK